MMKMAPFAAPLSLFQWSAPSDDDVSAFRASLQRLLANREAFGRLFSREEDVLSELARQCRTAQPRLSREELCQAHMIQLMARMQQVYQVESLQELVHSLAQAWDDVRQATLLRPLFNAAAAASSVELEWSLTQLLTLPLELGKRRPKQQQDRPRVLQINIPKIDEEQAAGTMYFVLLLTQWLYNRTQFDSHEGLRQALLQLTKGMDDNVLDRDPVDAPLLWFVLHVFLVKNGEVKPDQQQQTPLWVDWALVFKLVQNNYSFGGATRLYSMTSTIPVTLVRCYLAEQSLTNLYGKHPKETMNLCRQLVSYSCAYQRLEELQQSPPQLAQKQHHLPEELAYILQPYRPILVHIKLLLCNDIFGDAVSLAKHLCNLSIVDEQTKHDVFKRLFYHRMDHGKLFYRPEEPVLQSLFFQFVIFAGKFGFHIFALMYKSLYDAMDDATLDLDEQTRRYIQINCRQTLLHLTAAIPPPDTVLSRYSQYMPVPGNILEESLPQQTTHIQNVLAIPVPPIPPLLQRRPEQGLIGDVSDALTALPDFTCIVDALERQERESAPQQQLYDDEGENQQLQGATNETTVVRLEDNALAATVQAVVAAAGRGNETIQNKADDHDDIQAMEVDSDEQHEEFSDREVEQESEDEVIALDVDDTDSEEEQNRVWKDAREEDYYSDESGHSSRSHSDSEAVPVEGADADNALEILSSGSNESRSDSHGDEESSDGFDGRPPIDHEAMPIDGQRPHVEFGRHDDMHDHGYYAGDSDEERDEEHSLRLDGAHEQINGSHRRVDSPRSFQLQHFPPQQMAAESLMDDGYFGEESQISEGDEEGRLLPVRPPPPPRDDDRSGDAEMEGYLADATDIEDARLVEEGRARRHRNSVTLPQVEDGYDADAAVETEREDGGEHDIAAARPPHPRRRARFSDTQPNEHTHDGSESKDLTEDETEISVVQEPPVAKTAPADAKSILAPGYAGDESQEQTDLEEHSQSPGTPQWRKVGGISQGRIEEKEEPLSQETHETGVAVPRFQPTDGVSDGMSAADEMTEADDSEIDDRDQGDIHFPVESIASTTSQSKLSSSLYEHAVAAQSDFNSSALASKPAFESRESTAEMPRQQAHHDKETSLDERKRAASTHGRAEASETSQSQSIDSPRTSRTGQNIDMYSPLATSSLSATPMIAQSLIETPLSIGLTAASPSGDPLPPILEEMATEIVDDPLAEARPPSLQRRSTRASTPAKDDAANASLSLTTLDTPPTRAESQGGASRRSSRKRVAKKPYVGEDSSEDNEHADSASAAGQSKYTPVHLSRPPRGQSASKGPDAGSASRATASAKRNATPRSSTRKSTSNEKKQEGGESSVMAEIVGSNERPRRTTRRTKSQLELTTPASTSRRGKAPAASVKSQEIAEDTVDSTKKETDSISKSGQKRSRSDPVDKESSQTKHEVQNKTDESLVSESKPVGKRQTRRTAMTSTQASVEEENKSATTQKTRGSKASDKASKETGTSATSRSRATRAAAAAVQEDPVKKDKPAAKSSSVKSVKTTDSAEVTTSAASKARSASKPPGASVKSQERAEDTVDSTKKETASRSDPVDKESSQTKHEVQNKTDESVVSESKPVGKRQTRRTAVTSSQASIEEENKSATTRGSKASDKASKETGTSATSRSRATRAAAAAAAVQEDPVKKDKPAAKSSSVKSVKTTDSAEATTSAASKARSASKPPPAKRGKKATPAKDNEPQGAAVSVKEADSTSKATTKSGKSTKKETEDQAASSTKSAPARKRTLDESKASDASSGTAVTTRSRKSSRLVAKAEQETDEKNSTKRTKRK